MKQICNQQDIEDMLDQDNWILFKRSMTCTVSLKARNTWTSYIQTHTNTIDHALYVIDVIGNRPESQEIAKLLGVKHESPQMIIGSKGVVDHHASHFSITTGWLTNLLEGWHDTRK